MPAEPVAQTSTGGDTAPPASAEADLTLDVIAAQEQELQLPSFTNDDAWRLGVLLVEEARRRNAPVAIDISRNGHQLFHAALPGSSADNDAWLVRKSRVVTRFAHSSLYIGQQCRDQGRNFEDKYGLDPRDYAAHGGAFPLAIVDVGVVGVIAVSGLPQREDHRLVVDVLRRFRQQQRGQPAQPA